MRPAGVCIAWLLLWPVNVPSTGPATSDLAQAGQLRIGVEPSAKEVPLGAASPGGLAVALRHVAHGTATNIGGLMQ